MAATIPQVAKTMQVVLTDQANRAAKATKFVQRESKLTGAAFVQTLTVGWLANPQASLDELTQTAAALGIKISRQGLDFRFTKEGAACLKQVLSAAVEQVVAAEPAALPLLQRFTGVYVQDGSTVTLPDDLAAEWAGCGGSTAGTAAALKLQVRLELRSGALAGPLLQAGRAQDRTSPHQTAVDPPGSLRLADLGYFNLDILAAGAAGDSFWLTRWRAKTVVYDAATGARLDLTAFLPAQTSAVRVDHRILLGAHHRLPCRLIAARVPEDVANHRRQQLKVEARKKGQAASPERLALAGWVIFLTNLPPNWATPAEVLVLARVRWQIELLFKLWKSHGHIDEWRSAKPWRILCEVYAKLLAMVVQHWLFLVSNWAYPDRSLLKAAQTVRKFALSLASALGGAEELEHAITVIQGCLSLGCRIDKRKKDPSLYQLLLAAEAGGLA
jgi:hypothetical protein